MTVQAPAAPAQVIVDPDHALLDAMPDNNRWKPEVAWRFTPLMTPLDQSAQFQAYDRPSIVAGPFVDQYARARLQGRRAAGRPLGADRLGRHRAGLARGDLRRSVHAPPLPRLEVVDRPLLRGRALQLLQRQAALGRPGVPPLPLPRDVELPDRRPGVLRALLRRRLRVLGRRRRPPGLHRRPRGLRRAVPAEHALPVLGPGQGLSPRSHRRVRQHGVRVEHRLRPHDARVRHRPPVPLALRQDDEEPASPCGFTAASAHPTPPRCSGSAAAGGSAHST